MSLKLAIFGYSGRMGQAIVEAARLDGVQVEDVSNCDRADCMVDFSSPEGLMRAIEMAGSAKMPLVSGTTGLNDSHFNSLQNLAAHQPVLWDANMSLAVHLVKRYAKHFAECVPGVEVEIIDIHHKAKRDIPSGTAKMIASQLQPSPDLVHMRTRTLEFAREPGEVGIASVRGGSNAIWHEILCFAPHELVTIKHQAFSRAVYAHGAIKAARWLVNQPNGFYGMDDVLSLERGWT